MPTYVLDTTTLSDIASVKPSERLIAWLSANIGTCYISGITVHELRYGAARLSWRRSVSDRKRADRLKVNHAVLLFHFSDRIIFPGTVIMKRSGELRAMAEATYGDVGVADSIIAATAEAVQALVLTRNPKHFQPFGLNTLDSRIISDPGGNVTDLAANRLPPPPEVGDCGWPIEGKLRR